MRNTLAHSLPLLVGTLLGASLSAQTWNQVTTAANPGNLRDAAATFHAATGDTILFGGWPSLSATWLYDGTNWSSPTPANVPPARRDAAMVFDIGRGRTVMFGGRGTTLLNDTWEWDGTNWTQVTTAAAPAGRVAHSMAYDLIRGRTVLFGGAPDPFMPTVFNDTWEFDGTNWTQVTTAAAPSEAVDTAMCFDIGRGVCVLYGGTSFFGAPNQKTWEYNGSNWTDVTGTVGLGPTAAAGLGLSGAALVYDVARQRSLVHGGRTPNGTYPPETWAYDGTGWTMISTGTPSSRTGFAMAMDTTRDRVVLYGGAHGNLQTHYQETWEFDGGALASYTTFGAGCAGSGGVPALAPQGSSLPQSGQTLTVDITNLPAAGGFVFLAMGFDNTAWNGQALPLDLTAFGMPGCFGYVRIDATLLLAHAAGTATYSMTIPTGLDGLRFYQQALSVDPAAGNALGAAVSNAGEAVIGS